MTITRLQSVKDFRLFRNFAWPDSGLPEFDRYNLIYGWNGTGKTTLSRLFHALETRVPTGEGEARFLVDGQVVGTGDLSNAVLPSIKVFNRDTIERSVVQGAAPTVPLIYILGEESADKQARIDSLAVGLVEEKRSRESAQGELTQAQQLYDQLCTNRARDVRTLLTVPGAGEYNNYDARSFKSAIARAVATWDAPRRLSAEARATAKLAHGTPARPLLQELSTGVASLPDLANRVHKVLRTAVVVPLALPGLDNPDVADWVRDGLGLHTGPNHHESCRFCGHGLSAERLERLQQHFNDAVTAHLADIDGLLDELEDARSELEAIQVVDSSNLYPHLAPDWSRAAASFRTGKKATSDYCARLSVALSQKKKVPLQALAMPPVPGEAGETTSGLEVAVQIGTLLLTTIANLSGKGAIEQLNTLVRAHNQYTANYKAEAVAARRRLEEDILTAASEEYKQREKAVQETRARLATHDREIQSIEAQIGALEGEIRDARKPAERLTQGLSAYLGRGELEFTFAGVGYRVSRLGEPATHLSEGERTAVAFVHFLETLTDEGFDLANGVVVVDDPVSSLDSNALYNAFAFMKDRIPPKEHFRGQLFVLTHSFAFFRAVKNWFAHLDGDRRKDRDIAAPRSKEHARYYSLRPFDIEGKRAAGLALMDPLLYRFESEYHYLFGLVAEAASGNPGELSKWYNLPNVGRRLLESVMSFKAPGKVGELNQQLESVVGFDQSRKTRIVRFCHAHSHGGHMGETDADMSVLAETPDVMREILALVQHLDQVHFKEMMDLVGGKGSSA